ncbi:esterase/lipase family protein [Coralloluteibacterium stylophorae]|uniref:AB hydrolase-1 domain-containing protein n=1 Tax=Coralloluteibacterium stylophorae TaxID=1776034 RepID=A0A8J7VVI8_9GAMM|nr:hypothetical protein [Coralloluteibacterium stylophorae]MBS7456287.1 hypothetical protein [Coralloluteibacterium stylophorae]
MRALLQGVAAFLISTGGAATAQPSTAAADMAADGPATGLADSAALRATVFGTGTEDRADLPETVPVREIEVDIRGNRPVPEVFWFNRRLTVWFSDQGRPAPLAVVVAGTGGDGNTEKIGVLRAALYGAGYHVLTVPSPTFPQFITAASSTGVAGDLWQDGHDLHRALVQIRAALPGDPAITDMHLVGYSLGGANAAVVKAVDAREGGLGVHRVVMVNPPVSLFSSIGRLDRLFAQTIGSGDAGVERLYRQLYAELANRYVAWNAVQVDEQFLLRAAAGVLQTDAEFSAAIALTFRLALANIFFAGDLYAGTGVVVDPDDPPEVGDPMEATFRALRSKTFADYFDQVFAPYYMARRPGITREELVRQNTLRVIGPTLADDGDYYVQTNSDDLILDAGELAWLRSTLGPRIRVYDHGGHLGNIGERAQIQEMLAMLAGRYGEAGR